MANADALSLAGNLIIGARMDGIELVLFDVSGVLVELAGMSDFEHWTGLSSEEIGPKWLCSKAARDFESGKIPFGQFHQLFVSEWEIDVTAEELLKSFEASVRRTMPGAFELVSALKQRYRLGCLTNTNPVQWPIAQETIDATSNFEYVFASHLTGRVKPDVEAFEHVVMILGIPPRRMLYFDDSATNVLVANTLGFQAHRVTGANEARRILTKKGML